MKDMPGETRACLIGTVVGFICLTVVLLGVLGFCVKSKATDAEERIHLIDACAATDDPATCIIIGDAS